MACECEHSASTYACACERVVECVRAGESVEKEKMKNLLCSNFKASVFTLNLEGGPIPSNMAKTFEKN